MKRIKLTGLGLFLIFCSHGQLPERVYSETSSVLKVGDKMPDVVLSNLINYPQKETRFSALKGKWVILDFWNIYCAPCIRAFPKMENFLLKYKDKLQIIAFTENSKADIEKLKTRSVIARNTKLPILFSDTVLVKFLSTKTPHHIWVDPEGYVRYIAEPHYADDKNVARVLNGENVDLPDMTVMSDIDETQPLFLVGDGRFANYIQQYSFLMGYVEGLRGRIRYTLDPDLKVYNSYTAENMPIIGLYKQAYKNRVELNVNDLSDFRRVMLHVKDSSRYVFAMNRQPGGDEFRNWLRVNSYCYGIKTDPHRSTDFGEIIAKDLDRLFHIESNVTKIKINGWALIRTDSLDRLLTNNIPSKYKSPIVNDTMLSLRMAPISFLIKYLLYNKLENPFLPIIVDETGYSKKIDVDLNLNAIRDRSRVNAELSKYGLKLIEKELAIDFLVLRER